MTRQKPVLASIVGTLALGVSLAGTATAAVPGQAQIHGTITAIVGKYDIHVEKKHGEIDDVRLHQGTIINPTGLTLRDGMRVTILGNKNRGSFEANEIDTPYHTSYRPEPALGYYGAPYAFGYDPYAPFYGDPFYGANFYPSNYGYGPTYVPDTSSDSADE